MITVLATVLAMIQAGMIRPQVAQINSEEEMEKFEIGQTVKVVLVDPLPGNDVAPDLTLGDHKVIQDICTDRKGNQHLDVGLESNINYVTSWETGEELPGGDIVHWCHPSRFELVS